MNNHSQITQYPKLPPLKKVFLKYLRPADYKKYKLDKRAFEEKRNYDAWMKTQPEYIYQTTTPLINHPSMEHLYKTATSFLHSGNSGDIIYALPLIYELSKKGKAIVFLKIDQPASYEAFHPLGNVMLTKKMAEMLMPLFLYQPQISSCSIYSNEETDYDLDLFRKYTFLKDRGTLPRWYFHVYGVCAPLYKPWLIAPKDPLISDAIVIARSHRYRNPYIDYSFLARYPRLIFLGVAEEYDDMKIMIPQLEYHPVKDFLEMATVINSCRLFIGNQSFPFSIAEALKVNRLLEIYYKYPNVIPEGPGANDFIYQPQFESMVQHLYSAVTAGE